MKIIILAASSVIIHISVAAAGQVNDSGEMFAKTGRLLAAAERLRVIKNTECGYALKELPPPSDAIVESIIIPKIKASDRATFRVAAAKAIRTFIEKSPAKVADLIKESKAATDGKTGCGIAVATLAADYGYAIEWFQSRESASVDWSQYTPVQQK